MLRITTSQSPEGAKSYYTASLARGDYYTQAQDVNGFWGGLGSARLGLDGNVEQDQFFRLVENRHPQTGEKLTVRNQGNRRVGFDFTFSAMKSISLVQAITGDERIREAFERSVSETMTELEVDARVRVRQGRQKNHDETRTTGNLVWARFTHLEGRPIAGTPDPHLHSHCFVFNTSFDGMEGRWKATDVSTIRRDASYYEAAFEARFAQRLVAMGYPIERQGTKGWELAGIDRSAVRKFSRRTTQIEEIAEQRGITDIKEKSALGAKTREAKLLPIAREDLVRIWDDRLDKTERSAIEQLARHEVVSRDSSPTPAESIQYAANHLFERKSVVPEKELWGEALRRGVGSVSVEEVHEAAKDPAILKHQIRGRLWCTTAEVLEEEGRLIRFARDGRGTCAPLAPNRSFHRDDLSEEQQNAVRHIWESSDRVIALRGRAGTGKTTLMKEAINGIEANGTKVFTFAPSTQASRTVLRDEGFANAETVSRLLIDEKLQAQVNGSVLWIDEAGLMGTRELKNVFDLAERQGCRVVLSGDPKQHGPVTRGDAMRVLEEQAGIVPAELASIRRQRGAYREAVHAMSDGTAEGAKRGFDKLDRLGYVVEIPGRAEREEHLANEYLSAIHNGKSVLVVSPTHAEGERTTARIRERLREEGFLGGEDHSFVRHVNLNWTPAERADAANYELGHVVEFTRPAPGFTRGHRYEVIERREEGQIAIRPLSGGSGKEPKSSEEKLLPMEHADRFQVYDRRELQLAEGDKVRFTQNGTTNDGKHRINNGAVYDIAHFTSSGDIELANGWTVPKRFAHIDHGYVTTSHASQGRTVDVVLLAQSADSWGATSREQWYVSCSRGKERLLVLTDDKVGLRETIVRSGERMSATELTKEADREQERQAISRRQQAILEFRALNHEAETNRRAATYGHFPAANQDWKEQQHERG